MTERKSERAELVQTPLQRAENVADRIAASGISIKSMGAIDMIAAEIEKALAASAPDHGGADAGVGAQIATLAQRFWTIHPRELQDKGMTREEFYIREMTALVAALSKPAPVAANASAELQNDLGEMLRALGMFDGAQPKSPHEVFQSAIAEMKRQIANASAEARLRDIAGDALSLAEELAESYDWLGTGSDQARADIEKRSCLEEIGSLRSELEAISTHPNASDCDKQGERTFGRTALCGHGRFKNRCPECDGATRQ